MRNPPARVFLICGIALIAAGWAVIYLGWWNSSRIDVETGQLPYIVSGGFGGLGLLLLGSVAVVIDVVQRGQWRAEQASHAVQESVDRVAQLLERREERDTAAQTPRDAGGEAERPRRPRRRRASSA